MKTLSPQDIQTQINATKDKEFTPAGKNGIKRLKLSLCHALRKVCEKTANTITDDTAIISAVGFGVLGISALEKLSTGNSLSSNILIPSTIAASLPFVANAAEKATNGLRNLEAKLIKDLKITNNINPALIRKSGIEIQ